MQCQIGKEKPKLEVVRVGRKVAAAGNAAAQGEDMLLIHLVRSLQGGTLSSLLLGSHEVGAPASFVMSCLNAKCLLCALMLSFRKESISSW